jgi:CheY-like chemotaxis protein
MAHIPSPPEVGLQEGKVILVVEDDADLGAFLVQFLRGASSSFYTLHAIDAPQARAIVHSLIPDLLLVDYWLPQTNGLELYDSLHERQEFKHVPALFMSAVRPGSLAERQMPFIAKPFDLDNLWQTIETLLPRDFHWLE